MKKISYTFLGLFMSLHLNAQDPYNNNNKGKSKPTQENKQPTTQTEENPVVPTKISRTPNTTGGNIDVANSIGALANLSTLLNDKWSPKFAFMKFQIGVGYQSLPVVTNNQSSFSSETGVVKALDFYGALKLAVANNKAISLQLSPYYNYGYTGITNGVTGALSSYGGLVTLFISNKKTTPGSLSKKIFFEGGYQKLNGIITDDTKSTNTDVSYNTLTAGAGIFLQYINDDDKEIYFKPGIYFQRPSFIASDQKPIMIGGLEINILSNFIINGEYSKNYFIGGVADYKNNFNKTNQSFFKIKLIKNGKIF